MGIGEMGDKQETVELIEKCKICSGTGVVRKVLHKDPVEPALRNLNFENVQGIGDTETCPVCLGNRRVLTPKAHEMFRVAGVHVNMGHGNWRVIGTIGEDDVNLIEEWY